MTTPAAEEAKARDNAVTAAFHAEALAHPEASAPEHPPAPARSHVVDSDNWWPNPGEDPAAAFDRVSVS